MLDATKNTHIMENVVPKLVSYMTMKNILRIQNQKVEDKVKEEEKAKRKAVLLAETGISFDENHDEPEHTEDKKDGKKGKKVKVEEIDPEVLEQRRQAAPQPDEMLRPVEQPAIEHGGDFVKCVGELQAAILHRDAGLRQRDDAAIDIGQLRHLGAFCGAVSTATRLGHSR